MKPTPPIIHPTVAEYEAMDRIRFPFAFIGKPEGNIYPKAEYNLIARQSKELRRVEIALVRLTPRQRMKTKLGQRLQLRIQALKYKEVANRCQR